MKRREKSGRVRRGREEWQRLLLRHEVSGLGIKAFCQNEQLSEASFYRWRGILNGNAQPREASAFVDLGPLRPAGEAPSRLELRLDLGDGLLLHLMRS